MKIAIDMRPLQTVSRFRGIGAHVRKIVEALAQSCPEHRFILMYAENPDPLDIDFAYPENFTKISIGGKFNNSASFATNWMYDSGRLLKAFDKLEPDLFFCTTFAEMWLPPPRTSVPTAVWVYDIIFFKFPEIYGRNLRNNFKRSLWRKKLEHAVHADIVIVSSNSVKNELCEETTCPLDKVHVIPLGVEPKYFNHEPDEANRKLNLPERFALFIGGLDPRKNLARTIEAYAIAAKDSELPMLVVAGKIADDKNIREIESRIEALGLGDKIVFTGFVSNELLPSLYAAAEFLLFPSLSEGFGLPVIEAMAAGSPVLTSNISSMPEVAGDCAILIEPYSIESIADGIKQLVSQPARKDKMLECGRERAKSFSWEKSARKLVEIFENRMV